MKLYDITGSPNCRKVRVLARELGLALELVPVPFGGSPDNPTGKVPTLVLDDGTVLWESGAILERLARGTPLMHADALRWLFFAASHLQPWLSLLGQERVLKPRRGESPDPAIVALAERELARFLPVLDAQLAGARWLASHYSIADIGVGCGLEGAEARGVSLPAHVHAWRERLRARPAWAD